MKRLAISTACVAFAILGGVAQAFTKELKISLFAPPTHTWAKALSAWGKELEKRTNGELTAALFPAGQMGPVNKQMDLVRAGVADVAVVLHGAYPGRFDLSELSQLPFTFGKRDKIATRGSVALTGMLPQLQEEHSGLKVLYLAISPSTAIFFNNAEVDSVNKMVGLRVRGGSQIQNLILEAWGAAPVSVAPAELSDSLQKGVIDGASFNFEAAAAFRMDEVVKSVTPIAFTAASFSVVMNQDVYDGLSDEQRKAIDETTGEAGARSVGTLFDTAEEGGRAVFDGAGVKIQTISDEAYKGFVDAASGVTESVLAQRETTGRQARSFYARLLEETAK
ncbi:TRAP transporter substrate-binding protein [Aminobacter sp. MSH1]|uniref:TRAP transporter substrate-binding protein n=1 Tax=Aminobacter sp. MSH1 TaxID=374606 RepID=UPI000D365A4E|nr:TRAP transporter substrate-binding protein [Aminobacter sp. MSH1]